MLVPTWVSSTWNMSGPLATSRLGILMSTVEPGSLLGPLFMAWNHIAQRHKENKVRGLCTREDF